MKCSTPLVWIKCFILTMTLVGCCRSTCDIWDDTKTASRYFGKGIGALAGQDGYSSDCCRREDFCCVCDDGYDPYAQFIPLEDEDAKRVSSMKSIDVAHPREMPGDPGSQLPGFDAFIDPATDPELARSFPNILFAYDSSQVKGEENVAKVRTAANYLKAHPQLYVFVEGHCDCRGGEAYNLALGARRANIVRNMLVAEGVDKDHVFTISFGKERLLVLENHEEAHNKNRRAEFKVYRP